MCACVCVLIRRNADSTRLDFAPKQRSFCVLIEQKPTTTAAQSSTGHQRALCESEQACLYIHISAYALTLISGCLLCSRSPALRSPTLWLYSLLYSFAALCSASALHALCLSHSNSAFSPYARSISFDCRFTFVCCCCCCCCSFFALSRFYFVLLN